MNAINLPGIDPELDCYIPRGYKYRTGEQIHNAWETPANWTYGAVPDINTDVLINIGNTEVNANSICRSVQVKPAATLTVNTGNILAIAH